MPSAQSVPAAAVASARRSSAPAASSGCPLRTAASISSGSAQAETNSSRRCRRLARCGRGQRPLVAAEPVVEDRGRPIGPLDADALAPGVGVRGSWTRSAREASASRPRERGEQQRRVGREARPGRLGDRVGLGDRGGRGCRSRPARRRERATPSRSIGSRASAPASRACLTWRAVIACQLSSSHSTLAGIVASQPQRKLSVARRSVVAGTRSSPAAASAPRAARALGDQRRQAVEQQIGRPRAGPSVAEPTGRRARRRAGRRRWPGDRRTAPRPTRRDRSRARARASSGSSRSAAFSSSGGAVASHARGERDLAAQQVDARPLQLVQRPGLGRRQQRQRRVERAGVAGSLRAAASARSRPLGAGSPVSATERAAGTQPQPPARRAPAPGRPTARAPARPPRPVPAPRRPDARPGGPGRPRDRSTSASARWTARRSCAGADRYTAERTSGCAERHPLADRQQAVRLARSPAPAPGCRVARPRATAAADRRPAPPPRSAADAARLSESAFEPAEEALLDLAPTAPAPSSSPNPPASCAAREPSRQLEQRQRIAARLGDDPVAHPLVEQNRTRAQQRARVAVAQAARPRARAVPELLAAARAQRTRARPRSASSRRATKASVSADA